MLEAYTALEAMEFLGMNNLTSMSAHRTATVIGKISSERLFLIFFELLYFFCTKTLPYL
jgi:hypothetical protein